LIKIEEGPSLNRAVFVAWDVYYWRRLQVFDSFKPQSKQYSSPNARNAPYYSRMRGAFMEFVIV
jgi:hypothetical protein